MTFSDALLIHEVWRGSPLRTFAESAPSVHPIVYLLPPNLFYAIRERGDLNMHGTVILQVYVSWEL